MRTSFDFCNLGFSIILFEEEIVPSVWECRKGDGWRGIFFLPFYMNSVWIGAVQTTYGTDPLGQADQTWTVCRSIRLLQRSTTGPCLPKQISAGWVWVFSSKTRATLPDHDINGLKVVFHNSLLVLLLSFSSLPIFLLFADLSSSPIFALRSLTATSPARLHLHLSSSIFLYHLVGSVICGIVVYCCFRSLDLWICSLGLYICFFVL